MCDVKVCDSLNSCVKKDKNDMNKFLDLKKKKKNKHMTKEQILFWGKYRKIYFMSLDIQVLRFDGKIYHILIVISTLGCFLGQKFS